MSTRRRRLEVQYGQDSEGRTRSILKRQLVYEELSVEEICHLYNDLLLDFESLGGDDALARSDEALRDSYEKRWLRLYE